MPAMSLQGGRRVLLVVPGSGWLPQSWTGFVQFDRAIIVGICPLEKTRSITLFGGE